LGTMSWNGRGASWAVLNTLHYIVKKQRMVTYLVTASHRNSLILTLFSSKCLQ
jgi:hypothetical protein